MSNDSEASSFFKETCLTKDDLYGYISGQAETERLCLMETHLTKCPDCRRMLADLLELLHPNIEPAVEEISKPSQDELKQTLEIIHEVSQKEHNSDKGLSLWLKWPVAAAAVIGLVALSLISFKYISERNKSEAYFLQARSIVEQSYAEASPSNLRLALPFSSASTNRRTSSHDALRSAENLFYQALAVREDMVEARLGLAYVFLNTSNFERSRDEFQRVLDAHDGNIQALIGRGIAQYEQAVRDSDPGKRIKLLNEALNDFDVVLNLAPESAEARYNKAWTLYESGRHKEALQQIQDYLYHDAQSVWADQLKNLRIKIQTTKLSDIEEKINQAAHLRDREVLEEIARQASYQMPAAIWSAMRRSLQQDQVSAANGNANAEDLRWAAHIMENTYSAVTSDNSFKALLEFYDGLSIAQRESKRALDRKFQDLVELYGKGKYTEVIYGSKSLESQYVRSGDYWQLLNLHHLRGNSFYLGKADYDSAHDEYSRMYAIAEHLESPDLMAKALGSLAMIRGMQGKYDDSMGYAYEMKDLAKAYSLDSRQAFASVTLGDQFRRLGQFERSLPEYAIALGFMNRLLNENQIIAILENLGVVMDRLDRHQEANEYFRLALQALDSSLGEKTIPETPDAIRRRLTLLHRQGDLAFRTGDMISAEAFFQKSLKATPAGMREIKAHNCVGLAEVYLGQKKIREAEDMLEKALDISASGQYPEVEWKARFIKGEISKEAGDRRGALSSFRQSVEVLERMRKNVQPENLRQSFLIERHDPYKAMVAILYSTTDDRHSALDFIDRAKSMTLKESLGLPEFTAESSGDQKNESLSLDSVSIVEYFFTKDRLLIFLTKKEQTKAVSLDISAKALDLEIQKYLESITNNDSETFSALARSLHGKLIAPIENYDLIGKSETLVFLPDGPLHLLPFAGLQDKSGHFLIEKKPIALAPSRSVFRHCLSSKRFASPNSEPDVLLIDGSSGLSNARDELAYLSRLYGKNALSLGPNDKSLFGQRAADSEIIHFAGHAIARLGEPALVLQSQPNEVYLDCEAISGWKLRQTRLVNLAGCSTGIGPIGAGESPWGLIPAFLHAGAPAIIASLTAVDDGSTKLLTRHFYNRLHQGVNKAEALQNAQLAILNSARSGHDIKPQSWVPYILIGDPQ